MTTASSQDLTGKWVGGANATGRWLFTEARFQRDPAGMTGSLAVASEQAAGLPIDRIVMNGDRVTFRIRTPLGEMEFDGRLTDDLIDGAITGAAPGAAMHLIRVNEPSAEQSAAAVGIYDLGKNQELLLTYRDFGLLTGIVFERRDGIEFVRRSFFAVPSGRDRYVTSGSIVQAVRRDETLTLDRGDNGGVVAIRWNGSAAPSDRARRIDGPRQVAVQFAGPAGPMSGTLFLPPGEGRHPGVVIVSGSGPTGRDTNILRVREFVRLGLAVLAWDKRGVGESAGNYMTAGFDDLAADAASALAYLRRRSEVDSARVGIAGHSQGGWIAPLAAARASVPPAWIVVTSGGPILPYEQEAWRARTQSAAGGASETDAAAAEAFMRRKWQYGFTGADWEGYITQAQQARNSKWASVANPIYVRDSLAWTFIRSLKDFDPMATPLRRSVPVLVLFGDHDEEQPVDQSNAGWLEAFRRAGHTDHEIVVVPDATHSLWLGTGSPRPLVSAPTEIIGKWLARHGMLPR